MSTWEDVQGRKKEMQRDVIAVLNAEEREILTLVLDLEWKDRHLQTPDIRKKLRDNIKQVIK